MFENMSTGALNHKTIESSNNLVSSLYIFQFGVSSPDGLKTVLKSKEDLEHEKKPKRIKK